MKIDARDLSLWERCSLLPDLNRDRRPERLPIRDATVEHFERGINRLVAGEDPEEVAIACELEFLDEAAAPGFAYHPGEEPYIVARDHGSWLSGALRLVSEITVDHMTPLPVYEVGQHQVTVWGFWDGYLVHFFRIVADFGERSTKTRWPELCAQALVHHPFPAPMGIAVSVFRLPRVSSGRLVSPLSVGYLHPAISDKIRLARIGEDEGRAFSRKWKRQGRWERTEIDWPEWRLGITADRCLQTCIRQHDVPLLEGDELREIKRDVICILQAMEMDSQRRKREACVECLYKKYCHGTDEERAAYVSRQVCDEALQG